MILRLSFQLPYGEHPMPDSNFFNLNSDVRSILNLRGLSLINLLFIIGIFSVLIFLYSSTSQTQAGSDISTSPCNLASALSLLSEVEPMLADGPIIPSETSVPAQIKFEQQFSDQKRKLRIRVKQFVFETCRSKGTVQ
jgi:hypothetical protein